MATAIQRRRGTTAQHANFTGLAGEITIDTTLDTIIVHDGSTAGGIRLAKYSEVQAASEGDITAVNTNAGSGLTGGTTTGAANIAIDYENLTGNLVPSANNTYSLGSLTNVWKDVYVGPGSLYVNGTKVLEDSSGTIRFTADNNQNISILTTGSGDLELTAGGDIQLKSNVTLAAGKTLTATGGFKLSSNLNMNSNNINNLDDPVANQDAATKAYVDAQVATKDSLAELSGDSGDITEGTNLFYTDARARGAVSVTDAGGDGSLAYNSTTGVITFTGPSASEVRAHFSGGTGISISSGTISTNDGAIVHDSLSGFVANEHIDHSSVDITAGAGLTGGGDLTATRTINVGAGDGITVNANDIQVDSTVVRTSGTQTVAGAKTFSNDIVISGNLTVSGTQTIVNSTVTSLADNIIELNRDASGTPSENAGITVNRGSSADVTLQWNEANDVWQFTNDGATYQNMLTDSTARALISAGGDLSYNSGTGVISFTERTDSEVRGLISVSDTGGDGSLAYNSGTGVITYTGPSASEVRAHLSGGTGIAYNSSTGVIALSDTGYISGVTAGSGLTGGGTSGNVTINVGAGTGITVAADAVSVDMTAFDTGDLTEGVNLYFTNARAQAQANVAIGNNTTDNVAEGSTNRYYTDARARAAISVSGDLSYNSTTGVISFTNDAGDIEGVTAGTGLSGGGTSGTVTLSLATSGVTAATYGDADSVAQVTFDAYGRATAASSVDIAIAGSQITSGTIASARLPELTVGDFAGASIQTSAEGFGDSDTVLMTAAAIADKIESYGYSTTVGDITGVTAGTGLTGGGTSGDVTLNVSGLTVAQFAGASIQTSAEAFGDSDTVLMTAAAVADKIESYGYSTTTGDITGVTAGTNLNGGGTSGAVTVNLDTTLTGMTAATFSGTVTANLFSGTATSARYADLAEKYATDSEYGAGTVVCFGGDAEVTACGHEADHRVAGVISTDPAYMMNSDAEGQYVALAGRVPCKVTGPVAKGDLMVSSSVPGHAKADNNAAPGRIIGKAIGSSEGGEAVIEVLVNMM